MHQTNISIQQEPHLEELVQSKESLVDATHHHVEDILNQDHGQTQSIQQGKHLLSTLESDLKGKTALQQDMEIPEDLLSAGKQVNRDFEEMVLNIAAETKGATLLPGLKSRDRIQKKMDDEYDGDANDIRDVVRGSIVFDSLESLYKAVAKVHSSAKILYVNDRFDNPRSSGYRDIKFNLEMKMPDGKPYVVELQFHLSDMLRFKEWETALYKERRVLEGERKEMKISGADPRGIKELEEKIARLQYDAKSVYAQVWDKYSKGTRMEH